MDHARLLLYALAIIDLVTIAGISLMKFRLAWVLLRRTWHWSLLGRGLLLMFLCFGVLYAIGVPGALIDILRGDIDDVADWWRFPFRIALITSLAVIMHALNTYVWPEPPAGIQWTRLLGMEREHLPR